MVEKTHTAGDVRSSHWPRLPDEIQGIASKIANFFAPDSDASSTDDTYEINIELPGVAVENIDVSVHDQLLTVKGEKSSEREEEGRAYYFSERSYGSFQRSFRLPPDADANNVTADHKDGVLTLRVAKTAKETKKDTKVKIRTA
jgi:HSP20 family protein